MLGRSEGQDPHFLVPINMEEGRGNRVRQISSKRNIQGLKFIKDVALFNPRPF